MSVAPVVPSYTLSAAVTAAVTVRGSMAAVVVAVVVARTSSVAPGPVSARFVTVTVLPPPTLGESNIAAPPQAPASADIRFISASICSGVRATL